MSRFEMIEPEGLEEALDVMAREGEDVPDFREKPKKWGTSRDL